MVERDQEGANRRAIAAPADVMAADFRARAGGWAKAVLHQRSAFQMNVIRIAPGGNISPHAHSTSHDLFLGIRGIVRIISRESAVDLGPGFYYEIPAGIAHQVANQSGSEEAFVLLIHTHFAQFDWIPGA